jgi:hypothetical protein
MCTPTVGIGPPALYDSCRDRHCPKLRPGGLHPSPSSGPLVLQNKKVIYDLLFRSSAETLLEVARNRKGLGAEIGFFSVLHSWSQKLETHPCLAGGERSWISSAVSLSSHRTFDLQSSLALSPLAALLAEHPSCGAKPILRSIEFA